MPVVNNDLVLQYYHHDSQQALENTIARSNNNELYNTGLEPGGTFHAKQPSTSKKSIELQSSHAKIPEQ